MPSSTAPPLPDYENPPVIEVVIGTQFRPLDGFLPVHHGLFWSLVRKDYPRIEQAAPLMSVTEKFADGSGPEISQIDISSLPPLPRVFYIDETKSWLIQLQPDRLLQNWRKVDSQGPYPRFPAVLEKFKESWSVLRRLCEDENIDLPMINQIEVTYVNHIPTGAGWNNFCEIGQVLPDLSWRSTPRFLPPPIGMAWSVAFDVPEINGRLRVSVKQVTRKSDNTEVFLCELTARGMPREHDDEAIVVWIEQARSWVVRAFADLLSDEIQNKRWGRKC